MAVHSWVAEQWVPLGHSDVEEHRTRGTAAVDAAALVTSSSSGPTVEQAPTAKSTPTATTNLTMTHRPEGFIATSPAKEELGASASTPLFPRKAIFITGAALQSRHP